MFRVVPTRALLRDSGAMCAESWRSVKNCAWTNVYADGWTKRSTFIENETLIPGGSGAHPIQSSPYRHATYAGAHVLPGTQTQP
jgi:hypothetical protein